MFCPSLNIFSFYNPFITTAAFWITINISPIVCLAFNSSKNTHNWQVNLFKWLILFTYDVKCWDQCSYLSIPPSFSSFLSLFHSRSRFLFSWQRGCHLLKRQSRVCRNSSGTFGSTLLSWDSQLRAQVGEVAFSQQSSDGSLLKIACTYSRPLKCLDTYFWFLIEAPSHKIYRHRYTGIRYFTFFPL